MGAELLQKNKDTQKILKADTQKRYDFKGETVSLRTDITRKQ